MGLHGIDGTVNSSLYRSGALSHAYIVWGGGEDGRSGLADQLASALICTGSGQCPCGACVHCDKSARHIHPDIITIDRLPEYRVIIVDQIRALREDAVIMPNEAAKKVYIIKNAGIMNDAAQNAMLKLLEEPPESAAFILVTENPGGLLPTVRSRCVEISADKPGMPSSAAVRDDAVAFYKALTGSPIKLAEFLFPMEKLEKNEFADFIDSAKSVLASRMRDRLKGGDNGLTLDDMMKAVGILDRARDYLEYNVSLGHITGMMCAELIR